MKRRYKILIVALVCLIMINPSIQMYDFVCDEYFANPGYDPFMGSPQYSGAFYWMTVDKEFSYTRTIITVNTTTKQGWEKEYHPTTEQWDVSFSVPDWALVEKVYPGPDIYEQTHIYLEWYVPVFEWVNITYWNGTHYVDYLSIEFDGWKLEYSGVYPWRSELYCESLNLTLHTKGHGWI